MRKLKLFGLILFVLLSALALFYAFTVPSNDLDWKDDLVLQASAQVDGDIVSFTNLRNSSYTKDGLDELKYYTQKYNASDIVGLWMFVEPFGAWDKVAHTMVSFEFSDGEFLLLSIEARQEKGEDYGALTGIFNQFETIYVWGTEYDMLTRRMLWLNDPIRMYKIESSQEFREGFFLNLVEKTNDLQTLPTFYNTWTSSCTSAFVDHIKSVDPTALDYWDHEFHFPGVVDRLFLKKGFIDFDGDYDALKATHTLYPENVNMSYDNFSQNFRLGYGN